MPEQLAKRLIAVITNPQGMEGLYGSEFNWLGKRMEIQFYSLETKDVKVVWSFNAVAGPGFSKPERVIRIKTDIKLFTIDFNRESNVSIPLILRPGLSKIELVTLYPEKPDYVPVSDPRELLVHISKMVIQSADKGELVAIGLKPAAAPVLPKPPTRKTNPAPLKVFFKQEITSSSPLRTLYVNETTTVPITVKNIGNELWLSKGIDEKDTNRVGLGFHWLDKAGTVIGEGRALLPYDLKPGTSSTLHVTIQAPSRAGTYTLRFSTVQEHVAWFYDKGAGSYAVPVSVRSK